MSLTLNDHSGCALDATGKAKCWGFGMGTVNSTQSFNQIALGYVTWCGLLPGGSVGCSGSLASAPSGVFTSIGLRWEHACGVRNDGKLVCWGKDASSG